MIAYFIVFLLIEIISRIRILNQKNNIYFTILLIFTSMRYGIGADFKFYYFMAEKINFKVLPIFLKLKSQEAIELFIKFNDTYVFEYSRLELMNKMIYKGVWNLELSPQIVIFFYGFLTLIFIKKGLDYKGIYNKNVWLVFLCYPSFLLFFFAIMRQGIATSIIFYAYKYMEQKKILKYIFWIIIASLFHKTGIIGIGLYILYNLKINKNLYVFLFPTIFFFKQMVYFIAENFSMPYRNYILKKVGVGGSKVLYLTLLIYLSILFLNFYKKSFYDKNNSLINIIMVGCYINIALGKFGHTGLRLSIYFLIFLLYLIPEIEKNFYKIKIGKIITVCSFMLLGITLYLDSKNPKKPVLIPYKTIFNKNIGEVNE